MERRTNTRVRFRAHAGVDWHGQRVPGEVCNLSLKGMFIRTEVPMQVGDIVGVSLQLTGGNTQLNIDLPGKVVRANEEGVGILFEDLDIDSFAHLRMIVSLNDGDPDKILNEMKQSMLGLA